MQPTNCDAAGARSHRMSPCAPIRFCGTARCRNEWAGGQKKETCSAAALQPSAAQEPILNMLSALSCSALEANFEGECVPRAGRVLPLVREDSMLIQRRKRLELLAALPATQLLVCLVRIHWVTKPARKPSCCKKEELDHILRLVLKFAPNTPPGVPHVIQLLREKPSRVFKILQWRLSPV